jgi:hypothetical protein
MKRILTLLLTCVATITVWAVQVNNTAGNLANLIDDTSITSLTITGQMDARDFKFIADNLNDLTILNLNNAELLAFNAKSPLFMSATEYDEKAIPETAFMGKKLRSVTLPPDLKKIGTAAFAGCEQLEYLTLPASVEEIEPYAFSACNKLKSVTIPTSLQNMGEGAFARCKSLKTVTINPSNSLEVGKDAFLDCTALSSVTLGENVTAIGPGAFSGCTSLKSPKLNNTNSLNSIGEAAFAGSAVETIALNNCSNLNSIGMWAFANTPLKSVTLPESLESLGDGAFYYDLSLEQIDLPNSITSLSNYLLAGDNAVDMDQPVKDGVTSIGDYAFYNWDQIRDFVFPASVEYVGTKAMAGQTSLEQVTANPTTVPELGDSVWAGVDQPTIPLKTPQEVIEDYRNAEQWKEFLIIEEENPPTAIDKTVADETTVKAHFSGTILIVDATAPIAKVSIYDTRGVLLSVASPGSERAQLDTSNFFGKFYIVHVILENGNKRSFKLSRQ